MAVPETNAFTIILLALLVDAIFAGLPGFRPILGAPIAAMAALSGWLDARLNRPQRSDSNRKFRGAVAAVFMLGLAFGIGAALEGLISQTPWGWMWELFLGSTMLTQRRGFDAAWKIRRAISGGELDTARALLDREVSHDTARDDAHALARGAIETGAMRICDGAVAPAFWYVLLGLPGLFAYRAINVMAYGLGDKAGVFAMSAARLDRVLNILPAPICGVIIAISASFAPTANPVRAFKSMRDAVQGRAAMASPWMIGTMAGALGIALGGPRPNGSEPWVGGDRARALPQDIGRANFIVAVAGVITAGAILVLALYAAGR